MPSAAGEMEDSALASKVTSVRAPLSALNVLSNYLDGYLVPQDGIKFTKQITVF